MIEILIVDDDSEFLFSLFNKINEVLSDGFVIKKICNNGKEAYEYIANNHIDVVLLDLKIPIISGVELLIKIKDLVNLPEIIVISGDTTQILKLMQNKFPIYYVFSKPVNVEALIVTLAEIKAKKSNKVTEDKIRQRLIKILSIFNFNISSLGYKYLIDCIAMCINADEIILPIEKKLYKLVAEQNNISNHIKVKWAIQKAISSMLNYTEEKTIKENFLYTSSPTPKQFITQIFFEFFKL